MQSLFLPTVIALGTNREMSNPDFALLQTLPHKALLCKQTEGEVLYITGAMQANPRRVSASHQLLQILCLLAPASESPGIQGKPQPATLHHHLLL